MSEQEQPQVDLAFEQALCSRHGEPFRPKWPSGYPLFLLEGFKRWLALPATVQEAGGDVAAAAELLTQRPLCCRLRPMQLLDLYTWVNGQLASSGRTLWKRTRRCHACGGSATGTTLAFLEETGWVDHEVCLACVAGVTGKLGTR